MKATRNTLLSLLAAALLVQLLIIGYNHATGFIHVRSVTEFLFRLAFSGTFSFVFGAALFFTDVRVIRWLDAQLPWARRVLPRVVTELLTTALIGAAYGVLVTATVHMIAPYEAGFLRNAANNALITAVINLIMMSVLEGASWYQRGQRALLAAETLERENLQLRFETLKQQLNPHFLFNALNTLSALIGHDDERAQTFVEEFSSVYRYTLDVIDRPMVTLREELEFAREYLALQQTRFRDGIRVLTSVDSGCLDFLLPPLAVQTLLENALKHNVATADQPLELRIETEGAALVVRNTLQPRHGHDRRSGVGLANLRKRYALISDQEPEILLTNEACIARLPLITSERHDSRNH
ncbi:MAG: histidine kinase [Bacteroidetes bacterium]|nr:histidine kinase [Bacteroidota bacterium]